MGILACKDLNRKEMAFLVGASTPGHDPEAVVSELKTRGIFKRVYYEENEDPSRSLWMAVLDRPAICQAVLECGVFCLNCPFSSPERDEQWDVLVRDSEQLNSLLAGLKARGVGASIKGLSGVKREEWLTSRQSEVLVKAISMGYFEFPRRVTLTQLSEQIGVKPSTLSQLLRAAEQKVMAKYAARMDAGRIDRPHAT